MDEAFEAVLEVIRVFKRLKVDYLIGGSLASSYHGIPRSTQDADLVADLQPSHIPDLAKSLRSRFYLDEEGIREAVDRRSSFNLIYLKTMFKVDVFVLKREPLALEEMRRKVQMRLDDPLGESIEVASAEDTVLQKLAWYRQGGEASERQWKDLLGVLKVRRNDLDFDYLFEWAKRLALHDLLQGALREAGVGD